MTADFTRSEDIRAANPVFGDNRLKLGVFGINWVGLAMTHVPGTLVPTWERSLEIGRMVDEAGLEAIVPVSRWKSHVPGKPEHRSSQCLEPFAWASAMAVSTRRAAVFATCHVAAFPPVLAAKQAATIDQLCGGRFGINVVAGWNGMEPGMFGAAMLATDERYAQASEWMEIVERVWESEEEFDFKGDWYDVTGAYTEPRPAQAPHPVVMNAGGSDRGRDFSARFSDMAFVAVQSGDHETARAAVDSYRDLAREQHGREVGVWTHIAVVHGDSDDHARALEREIYAQADYESVDTFLAGVIASNSTMPEEVYESMRQRMVLGSGGLPVVGCAETIADSLQTLSNAGVDGVLMTWVDYADGMRRFAAEVLPLLEDRGLRKPYRPNDNREAA